MTAMLSSPPFPANDDANHVARYVANLTMKKFHPSPPFPSQLIMTAIPS
jgi:hypothetical protein